MRPAFISVWSLSGSRRTGTLGYLWELIQNADDAMAPGPPVSVIHRPGEAKSGMKMETKAKGQCFQCLRIGHQIDSVKTIQNSKRFPRSKMLPVFKLIVAATAKRKFINPLS